MGWLPLDLAAGAVCEIALSDDQRSPDREIENKCEVYHVVNPDTSKSFTDILDWMKKIRKEPFEILEPMSWLKKLEKLENHPAKALIGLWRRAYEDDAGEGTKKTTIFETKNAEEVSQTMRDVRLVDEKLFGKIWKWLEGEMVKTS